MTGTRFGPEEVDFDVIRIMEREICYFYHRLEPYNSIMGDMDPAAGFDFPYWHFLDDTDMLVFHHIQPEEREFIRNGCVIMILTTAYGHIGVRAGAGSYLASCLTMVERLIPEDEKEDKFFETVKLAVRLAQKNRRETPELLEMSNWVFDEYVLGYFRERAERPHR